MSFDGDNICTSFGGYYKCVLNEKTNRKGKKKICCHRYSLSCFLFSSRLVLVLYSLFGCNLIRYVKLNTEYRYEKLKRYKTTEQWLFCQLFIDILRLYFLSYFFMRFQKEGTYYIVIAWLKVVSSCRFRLTCVSSSMFVSILCPATSVKKEVPEVALNGINAGVWLYLVLLS